MDVLYGLSAAVEHFRFNIYDQAQAFPPENAIFAGIGVLLLVGIFYVSLVQTILTVDMLTPGHPGS